MTVTLTVKDNGIVTADGKGILAGSILIVKGSTIPESWAGLVEISKQKTFMVAADETSETSERFDKKKASK